MRLSDLRDKPIRTLDGERLGRVHEVHCEGGKVVALMCGAASLLESLTGRQSGRRVPWPEVRKIDSDGVWIAAATKKAKPSAARSRPGTRRPSGRPSKR
jgi:sporulation protein YlmC with PRC-barrel domain